MKKLRCENSAENFATALIHVMESDKDEDYRRLCVPKIRFCNIGGEGRRELGVT
jgi:hypothetical protein